MDGVRTCVALSLVFGAGCGGNALRLSQPAGGFTLTADDLSRLATRKIFFGHQSVGDNIMAGVKELMVSDPRLKLKILTSDAPHTIDGPALVESHIGSNGDPQSKADAFAAVLDKGMGRQGGIAFYKYCYVDIDAASDIPRLFESYRRGITGLKARYPALQIVHVTVPLTTVDSGAKAWVKSILGRTAARDVNRKRNEYNRLLLQNCATDPIFDLAAVESTYGNGSRSAFTHAGQQIFTLAPEYTTDGGHLNETGRLVAAEGLLRVLARL